MKVEIEDILEIKNALWSINRVKDLSDIQWFYDGKLVDVQESDVDEWKFTGLNNVDFAMWILDKIHEKEEGV